MVVFSVNALIHHEPTAKFLWFAIEAFPTIGGLSYVFLSHGLFELTLATFYAILTYNGLFTIGHTILHFQMHIKAITDGFAYVHHYDDTSIFPKLPFGYRLSMTHPARTYIIAVSLITGMDAKIFILWMFLNFVDTIVHEYAHSSRASHYKSYNPFSGKFIGIHWMCDFLVMLNMADPIQHKRQHHSTQNSDDDHVHDWADLKFPLVGDFWNWVADNLWNLYFLLLDPSSIPGKEKKEKTDNNNNKKGFSGYTVLNIAFGISFLFMMLFAITSNVIMGSLHDCSIYDYVFRTIWLLSGVIMCESWYNPTYTDPEKYQVNTFSGFSDFIAKFRNKKIQ